MSTVNIPLDKAELLSVILEAILYGFSLLMFGGTIWTLLYQRSTHPMNSKMLTVACLLLVMSTAHIIVHIIRVMYGLILYRDTWPGGPVGYFSDVSQWTFNVKNHLYIIQSLIGDAVILYRVYMVWQSKSILIAPSLLWCAAGVTGITASVVAQDSTQSGVFGGPLQQWITAFWATSLSTNLLVTLLLIGRIWYIDRKVTRLGAGDRQSPLRPILQILIDAGAIYTLTLVVALICFLSESNGQYVVLDMVTPIISITFYMVIIRVGRAARATRSGHISLGNTSLDNSLNAERRRQMQVHITTLTESKIDRGQRSRLSPSSNNSGPNESKFDGGEAEV